MATAGDRDRDLSQDLKESGDWDDLSRGEKACLGRGTIWRRLEGWTQQGFPCSGGSSPPVRWQPRFAWACVEMKPASRVGSVLWANLRADFRTRYGVFWSWGSHVGGGFDGSEPCFLASSLGFPGPHSKQ